jgi:hypothetical protein
MLIEKGVPMPARRPGRRRYPFREMEVGDSFVVETVQDRERVKATLWHYTRTGTGKGRKFASRKVDEGFRIWRTE